MVLISVLKSIYDHPFNKDSKFKALQRFFKWQFSCYLNPFPVIYPMTENSKIILKKGLSSACGNLYSGLYEYEEMVFLLNFLRPESLFVDIGANIGVYTILASGEIGAKSIAFEPVPETYDILKQNIEVNAIQNKVQIYNIGIGDKDEILKFTKLLGSSNSVSLDESEETVDVQVKTLDEVLNGEVPELIKIDVEGFETQALMGAKKTLENPNLKAVIMETNGYGMKYGYSDDEPNNIMVKNGFTKYQYDPFKKVVTEITNNDSLNAIYIRDLEFVQNRLKTARPIKVGTDLQVV